MLISMQSNCGNCRVMADSLTLSVCEVHVEVFKIVMTATGFVCRNYCLQLGGTWVRSCLHLNSWIITVLIW
jgi:hypothetical protein